MVKVIAKSRKGASEEYATFKKSANVVSVVKGRKLPFGYHLYDVHKVK